VHEVSSCNWTDGEEMTGATTNIPPPVHARRALFFLRLHKKIRRTLSEPRDASAVGDDPRTMGRGSRERE